MLAELDEENWVSFRHAKDGGDIDSANQIALTRMGFYEAQGAIRRAGFWGRHLSYTLYLQARYEDALRQAIRWSEIQSDPVERALCLLIVAGVMAIRANHRDAEAAIASAEEIARYYPRYGYLLARVHDARAVVCDMAGNTHEGIKHCIEAVPIWRTMGDHASAGNQLNNLGEALARDNQLAKAEDTLVTALGLLDRQPVLHYKGAAYDTLGWVYTLMGRYDKGERLLQKSIGISKMIGDDRILAEALLHLSELHLRTRRRGQAHDDAAKALALATKLGLQPLVLRATELIAEAEPCHWNVKRPSPFHELISENRLMCGIIARLLMLASTNEPVLLCGETGAGKELLARAIHLESKRCNGPFIPFNCSALSRDLIESRLFGHRRGAFTGAHQDSAGVVRAASGGTLLLDEIGDLTTEAQGALLRFLQSGEIQPVGASKPIKVDVRVVAATNRDLREEVEAGRFRKDLFYRLNVTSLWVPPLRSRPDDIPLLARHFAAQYSKEYELPEPGFSREEIAALINHDWPGNVRELQSYVKRRVLFGEEAMYQELGVSSSDGLCYSLGASSIWAIGQRTGASDRSAMNGEHNGLKWNVVWPEFPGIGHNTVDERLSLPDTGQDLPAVGQRLWVKLTKDEKHSRLAEALESQGGNVTASARVLGISRRTIQRLRKSSGQ